MNKKEIYRFLFRKTSFSEEKIKSLCVVNNQKIEKNHLLSILRELERRCGKKLLATGEYPFCYLKVDLTFEDVVDYFLGDLFLVDLLVYPKHENEKLDFLKVKLLFMLNRICDSEVKLDTLLIDLSLKGMPLVQPRDILKIVEDKMKIKPEFIEISDFREVSVSDFAEKVFFVNETIKTLG